MKKIAFAVALAGSLLVAPHWATAQTDEEGPGGKAHLEQKLRLKKPLATKAPSISSCGLTTPDFVVTGSESTAFGDEHCFPSDGTGVFAPRSDIPGLAIVDGMDVVDTDNDGDNDFFACDGLTSDVYLYTQGPAGVFVPSLVANGITSGVNGSLFCTNLREGDFNGDGLADFVVGDNRVTKGMYIYLQGPVGTFTPVAAGLDITWASPTGVECNCIFGVAAGDVNADGHDDVLVLGYRGAGRGQVWYYQGNGTGAMAPPILKFNVSADFPVSAFPTGLALFDLEGDGDLDAVAGGSGDGTHYIYTNDGLGNFATPAGSAFDVNSYSGIDAYDVDGDAKEDLMLVDWWNRNLLYSQNLGGAVAAPAVVNSTRGPSIGIGAPKTEATEGFDLDHFKCYYSESDRAVESKVKLTDQFLGAEGFVHKSNRFCNPVEKHHDDVVTRIQDKDAHLTFYILETDGQTPSLVEVDNQFGKGQKLEIGRASWLAVPTQKIEPNAHAFPEKLDHFKCYDVFGRAPGASVDLRDQFGGESNVRIYEPKLLCNPTQKIHNDRETPIQNPFDHLVCYQAENTQQIWDFAYIHNQFGEEQLRLDRADWLCVPSKKKVID